MARSLPLASPSISFDFSMQRLLSNLMLLRRLLLFSVIDGEEEERLAFLHFLLLLLFLGLSLLCLASRSAAAHDWNSTEPYGENSAESLLEEQETSVNMSLLRLLELLVRPMEDEFEDDDVEDRVD